MSNETRNKEDYTKLMKDTIASSIQKFNYAKEDIQAKFDQLDVVKKSTYVSRRRFMNEFIEMLEKSFSQLVSPPDYLPVLREKVPNGEESQLTQRFDDWISEIPRKEFAEMINNVPTRKQLSKSLFQELYKIYKKAPTPSAFMRRLVLRLGDDDLIKGDNSVKMVILKQFLRKTTYETNSIFTLLKRENKELENEALINTIPESIFEGISWNDEEKNTEKAYNTIEKLAPTIVENIIEDVLAKRNEEEIVNKVENIVEMNTEGDDRYIIPRFGNEQAKNFVLVAKPIVRSMIVAKEEGKKRKEIENEGAKNAQSAVKNIIKRVYDNRRNKYPLLVLADNLAEGKYRMSGRTKTDLYMFAMAFGMTIYLGIGDEYDSNTDIEKNLFHDYYNDNLLRYLTSEYKKEGRRFEAEPTGEGINYKNYAEIIYIYYLSKRNMTAREKINRSRELIGLCMERAKEGMINPAPYPESDTEIYKKKYIQEIMHLDEEELVNYICNNFVIPTNVDGIVSQVTVAGSTNTAKKSYGIKVEDIGLIEGIIDLREEGSSEAILTNKGFDASVDFDLIDTGFNKDEGFMNLLKKLDDKLRDIGKYSIRELSQKMKITRTQLIGVHYYYYREELMNEEEWKTLPDLYNDFCTDVNKVLEEARFQKISEKNIFDMFIILVLYYEQLKARDY